MQMGRAGERSGTAVTERGRGGPGPGFEGARERGLVGEAGEERDVGLVSRQRLTAFVAREDASHLERLADLVETGHVTAVVDQSYPLSRASDAITHLESGQARGRIAIDIDTRESR